MITQQPSDNLFALLDFCGIRQRDIVKHLGVSKALVSLWRSGQRDVPATHHAALIAYAEATFWAALHAWHAEVATQELPPEAIAVKRQEIAAFVDLVDQARAERDLELMHFRVVHDITRLAQLAQTRGGLPWEEATLTEVEACAQRIVTAIGFLRSHAAVTQTQPAPAVETLAARLTEFVEGVLRPWRPQPREP
jgi:DNA-binding transcriptional regulator YdaS (Cro superfamily)